MKISHNTFTYLRPKHWWQVPFLWMGRCQSRPYYEQDCDGYDVRVWWDAWQGFEFRHGGFSYPVDDWIDFLTYCNENKKVVRLMFECRSSTMLTDARLRDTEAMFKELCQHLQKEYPNIMFFGGRNVYTWEQLYDFGWEPQTFDYYASQEGGRFAHWCPWLWAKRHNGEYLKKEKVSEVCLYDFL